MEECISEEILVEFFRKHRKGIMKMGILYLTRLFPARYDT